MRKTFNILYLLLLKQLWIKKIKIIHVQVNERSSINVDNEN